MAIASDRIAIAVVSALALSGCAQFGSEQTYGRYDVAPQFGEALKYDMAIQTVDPDPLYPEGAREAGSNGDAARAAAERYRKGTVKAIERESTTQASSGSGGTGSK